MFFLSFRENNNWQEIMSQAMEGFGDFMKIKPENNKK